MPKKDPLQKKRIFVGFNSAGSAGIYAFTRVLRRRGYQIDFYGIKKTHFDMPVDFLLEFSENPLVSFFQRTGYFFKILPRYDIWHFNYMDVFFFYPLNLFILKLLGKKIIATFRGIEVQTDLEFLPKSIYSKIKKSSWPKYYQLQFLRKNLWPNLLKKIRRQIFIWFADEVTLTGPFLAPQVSHYDQIISYAREIKVLSKSKKSNQKIKILHVPSDPVVKGTEIIEKTFKKLQKKYPKVEFRICQKLSHEKLLKEIASSDIVVDQLLIGWYGGQAVEAMAMGKIVMAYLNPAYLVLVSFGKKIPIINTNYWSFEQDLEYLIKAYPLIYEDLEQKSYKFAKNYHSAAKIAGQYLSCYRSAYE